MGGQTQIETQQTLFELQATQEQQHESTPDRQNSQSFHPQELKPVDRGRDAWVVLIAGFVFEALFWGRSDYTSIFEEIFSKYHS
jgi:hypothetical protein